MKCPGCGEEIKDNLNFCPKCGKRIPRCPVCGKVLTERIPFCANDGTKIPDDILMLIPEKPTASANSKRFCIKCGKPCADGETLCVSCKKQPARKTGKGKAFLIITIIVIVLIIIAAAAAVFILNNNISSGYDSADEISEGSEDGKDEFSDDEHNNSENQETQTDAVTEESSEPTTEMQTEIRTEDQTEALQPAYNNSTSDKTPIYSFNKAIASSQLADQGSYSYSPYNVIDGNPKTAWVEGISGTGEGEWIEVQSDYVETIHKIGILNGYQLNDSVYEKNGRVISAMLSFSDGSSQTVNFDTVDKDGYTYFNVGTKETSFVRITLLSCRAGSEYEDICLSEIKIY